MILVNLQHIVAPVATACKALGFDGKIKYLSGEVQVDFQSAKPCLPIS